MITLSSGCPFGRRLLEGDGVSCSIPGEYAGALAVLSDPSTRPTAIVAGCDEIAIVGIDGHTLAEMFGLTTLEQHPSTQGEVAAQLILDRLEPNAGAIANEWITMPVDFVVRRSTTAPPPAG